MAEGSQEEDHAKFLPRSRNFISSLRGGGRNGRSHDHRGRDKRPIHTPHVCRWRIILENTIRALLQKAPSKSKKPDGSSHHTPYWFQWRSHMANGADIVATKNRRCGTFNFYMNELRGSKVTISIQRNHRKTRCEKNSSIPINGSRNAKILGPKRSTYSTEQQVNFTRMRDGL
ncbi:hypothetical protein Tco_1150867 [Tanacetum coccineum]